MRLRRNRNMMMEHLMAVIVAVVVLVLVLVGSPAVVGHPQEQHRRHFDSRPVEKVVDHGPASEEAKYRTPTAVGWLEKILPFWLRRVSSDVESLEVYESACIDSRTFSLLHDQS